MTMLTPWTRIVRAPFFIFIGVLLSSVNISFDVLGEEDHAISSSAAPALTFTTSDFNGFGVSCNGVSDGSIDMTITGGTAPFNINWSTGATTEDISTLSAGTYVVTVIDAVNDTVVDSVSISEPAALTISFDLVQTPDCNGGNNGSADISVSGGVPTYDFLWSTGATTEDISGLDSGLYTITVTDLNLCTLTLDTLVDDPSAIQLIMSSVDANGAINGEASVSPSGGIPSYSYLWSTSATTDTITGLLPGTYTVTVTDQNSCTATDSVVVNNATGICDVVVDSINLVTCFGSSDGAIFISVNSIIPPVTYQWSTGATSQDITGLAVGTYTVTITDTTGCTDSVSVAVTGPLALNDSVQTVNETCGLSNGAITVFPYGGTPSYTYLWNGGQTSQSISSLGAGSYTVTITDSNGCTRQRSVNLINIPGGTLSLDSIVDVSCNGLSDGGVFVKVNGGTVPFTYIWNNGATTQDITGVISGNYTVTVTDGNSCISTLSASVNQPAVLNDSTQSTSATCGLSNGSVTIFPYGGTPSYTYLWSSGQTTQSISSLAPGPYTVTVTDANSCTRLKVISISSVSVPVLSLDSISDVSCNGGADGAVYVRVSGGVIPYSYLWNTGVTTQDITGLSAGSYTVTVTDGNSCTSTLNAAVSQPAVLSDSVQVADPTCGQSNGSATVFPYGGTSPYDHLWSTGQTTQSVTGLSQGTFTVTITDANNCTRQRVINLVNIPGGTLSLDSISDVSCNGGSDGAVYVKVNGGNVPFSYIWSTGATTQDITGVPAGSYTVTVTDGNSCTSSLTASVNEPSALNDSVQSVNPTCGLNNGSIIIYPFGGTPSYSYLWNTGQTTQSVTGLGSGSYSVTITDVNNCTRSRSVSISNLNGPAASIDSVVSVKCNGDATGGIFISVINGVPPYSYLWSNGATTQDLQNVVSGTYTVTISDDNNCQIILFANITQPSNLTAPLQVTNASCGLSNGSATVNPAGGVAPYTYLWSNGQTTQTATGLAVGAYTVTVTDQNACTRVRNLTIIDTPGPAAATDSVVTVLCNGSSTGGVFISVSGGTTPYSYSWSNGATTQDVSGVPAGVYTVNITDNLGCTISLTETVNQLTAVDDSLQITTANCGAPTGSATVFPFGGTGPYTYLWSTGQTTATIFNLNAGSYVVTVTDVNGCTAVDIANISNIGGPSVVIDSIRNVSCKGGSDGGIFISVSGGTMPYGYLWSNSATAQDLTGVSAGTYTVTITDNNNCSAIVSSVIQEPQLLQDTISITDPTCGVANGILTAFPYGGTSPYTYLWSGGQTNQAVNALAPGTYTVTVTDNNGCTVQDAATLVNVAGAVLSLDSLNDVTCFSGSDGAIYISPSGGTIPFTYLWSNGSTTQDIQNVTANTYTVTITDGNGCTDILTSVVSQPPQITSSSVIVPEACGSSNGSVTITPSGGVSPYSFFWSNSQTTQNISGLVANNYTVTITDNNSCTRSFSYAVGSVSGPSISTDSTLQVSCNGFSDGAIYVSVSQGTPSYTYLWSTGATTQDLTGLPAGTYTLTATDSRGCTDQSVFSISQPTLLTLTTTADSSTCNASNGVVTSLVSGGTPSYGFLWSTGQTTSFINNLSPGTYTLTVTDNNGCVITDQSTVVAIPLVQVSLDSIVDVSCNGLSDGSIYIAVSLGNSPYSYQWSNGATTQDLTGVIAGSYTFTVTDDDNCTVSNVYNIVEPDVLADSTQTTDATCSTANGSATVFPYGGTPPYSYLWNNGATTQSISGLVAGQYTVTITDGNTCTKTSGTLVSNLGAPVIGLDSIVDVTCNGFADGAVFINVTSGTPPLTFTWSSGQTTEDITGIGSGVYTVTVTDINNCISLQTFSVGQPSLLQDTLNVSDAHCGNNDGSAQVFPFGGVSPYSYLWSGGQTTQSITGVPGGVYTVTITDDNNCTADTTFSIADLPGPSVVLDSVLNVLCNSDSTGSVFISVASGSLPYTYQWSDGSASQDLLQVPAGIYTVTITDLFSCTTTLTQSVSQPDSIIASFSVLAASCNTSNGTITTQVVSGGTPGYSYLWSTGATTADIDSLPAGTYTLTITDMNNCEEEFVVIVNNIAAPVITVVDSSNVTCSGLNDGFIRVEVTGGTPPYNYSWTNTTQTGDLIFNLQGNTTYTLTITDSLGCITTRSVFISEPDPIIISGSIPLLNGSNHISCFGLSDGSIDLTVTGGSQPYTYQWSNLATTEDISGLSAGTYTISITDSNSCVSTTSFILTQPQQLISNAGPNNVVCGTTTDTLNANIPVTGTGYWVLVSGSATFVDSTLASTVVTGLGIGTNILQWVITDGVCTSISQTAITVNTNVQAIPGVNRDVCADSVLLNAVPPQFGSGVWSVIGSTAILSDSSLASTYAVGLNPGVNVFQWKVVNGTCSDSALIAITLLDPSECVEVLELPTGFTPNGDGKNDYLIVKGIDDFPDNTLLVYNRWGSKVFEKNNYRNDWSGENMDGEPLPAGTYFVIFKSRSSDQVITSYIDLRR